MSEPITPYACSLGTVVAHEDGSYIITTPQGRTIGIRAATTPSEAAVEEDIANPPAPLAPVPESISRARFVIAARKQLGLTEGAIFALLSGIEDPEDQEDARDLWENAIEFKRANRFVLSLAAVQGLTSEQIDDFFRYAAALDLD